MRLIDSDAFIEYLGLNAENAREDNVGEIVTLEDFDRQPTAFDKEKVINEIHISSAGMALSMSVSSSYAEGYIDAAKDIIKIVEKGGIE